MSWQAVRYAVSVLEHDDELTTADRLVLVLLAEHARADGSNARPSSELLARKAGIQAPSVRRSLARLVAAGIIAQADTDRLGRTGRPTVYRFPLSTGVTLVQHPQAEGVSPLSAKVQPQGYRGVTPGLHEPIRTGQEPAATNVIDMPCPWCDNTGWEYEDENHVRKCRHLTATA